MANQTYEFLENNEWVVKTRFTQEVDVDVSKQLKTIREYRLAFAKAWASICETVAMMEDYCTIHGTQNELLKQLWDYLGEDYVMPELKCPLNSKELLKQYSEFLESERAFRKAHGLDWEAEEVKKLQIW